jgi:hypothetical protein
MNYSRISRAESLPVSASKHFHFRTCSNGTSVIGKSIGCFSSRSRALAISVLTPLLFMLGTGKDPGKNVTDLFLFSLFTHLSFLNSGKGQMQPLVFIHLALSSSKGFVNTS